MVDEFQEILAQGEFRFGFKLLSALWAIRSTHKKDRPWAVALLDHFFVKISSPRVLGVLSQVLPSLDELDSDRMKLLRQCLVLLRSEAIMVLGPMILEMRSSRMQQQLMKIIGIMAKRDLRPLERLLESPEEVLVQKLVYILGHLEGERPAELLLKMVRHSSARVRRQAIRQLMVKDEQMLKRLFPLIEDSDASIRRLMLKQLGEARDELAERLLLDYLKQRQFGSTDHQHILACYSTLGRCGSQRSVPFLRQTLVNRGWIFGNGRSIHRRGAAIALIALGTEEAREILRKASCSLSPIVRLAYRKALEASR
jgi:HEAT repeat protein